MTDWTGHHPPHDHPDFDAYLDSLTDDDIAAINDAIGQTTNEPSDSTRYRPQHHRHADAETTPNNEPNHQ
jgi:hypothetical protein